jgi:putative ABC transport system ATP-binding protein
MTDRTGPEAVSEPAATNDGPILAATGLVKSYRRGPEEVHALRGVDLSLMPGQVVGLVGRSGSGKTTLLNCLAGWEHPDEGAVVWGSAAGTQPPPKRGRRPEPRWHLMAILPQGLGLVDELSVRENVELPARLARREDGLGRAEALIEALGLGALAHRLPSEVSLGEQQRTALARALVLRPAVLLADEPTGHQDAGWSTGVFNAIRAAAAEGTACLIATHNHEVLRFTNRVVAIADGVRSERDAGDSAGMRRRPRRPARPRQPSRRRKTVAEAGGDPPPAE